MAIYAKEFIVRYAEDELDAAERQQFEADLRDDPALQAELDLYLEVRAGLRQRLAPDQTKAALEAALSSFNEEYFGTRSSGRIIMLRRWFVGVAAAVLLIVGSLVVFLSPDKNELIDRLGRTEMIGTTDRGDNMDTVLQAAAGYFNRQEFSKVLPLLDSALKGDSVNQLARFYHGVAAWHTGAIPGARIDLERVYASGSLLRYDAAFYLALSYAAEKNNASALQWLDRIPTGTPVDAKVKELRISLK